MTSRFAQQRKILKEYKFPDQDEPLARINYYREARHIIDAYHRNNKNPSWLMDSALTFDREADTKSGQARNRLKNNVRAIKAYNRYFSSKNYTILKPVSFKINIAGVTIVITPDLHLMERKKEKILKLSFASKEPADLFIKVICQTMFEAASENLNDVTKSTVVFLDVPRGNEYHGAHVRARMRQDIEAACQSIHAIWGEIAM